MAEFVYKSKLLCDLYCKWSRVSHLGFKNEVLRRNALDIFDYKGISQPLPKVYYEICTDNNCFGIGYSIRQYAGYKKPFINGWIEHGYFYADAISDLAGISFTNNILTFGGHRELVNNKLLPQKKCFKIGPYVHYANDYVNEDEFIKIKKKLGKVLLVFPIHSGTGEKVLYEIEELFKIVNSVADGFDTVLFSLFWSDITEDYASEIEKRGYKIVCSGHRFDPFFLTRQKTIIRLADVTMSNGLGTNLVYCTYLKKPHWLVKQDANTLSLGKTGEKHKEYEEKNKNNSSIESELYDAFREYRETLSESQYQLCSKLFGFEEVKTPIEMLSLLKSL